MGIARHYRALEQPEQALSFYRLAYASAQAFQQYDYGSLVLRELGEIYQSLGQLEEALSIYRILIQVERQTYNAYGIMAAFDQIGQIYRAQGKTEQARTAFQEALLLATQLSAQESYFQAQLQSLSLPAPVDSAEPDGWRSGSAREF
ncbi:MAG: tetratricopeptide repeat protein [Leptolyngbyaceae cyanobacterium SM1_1_3]|nr:tetratricopeptide repeat protein [Leptolyngbyaceae cyanobacterium SM1_1_3]NJO09793.1 tetratricopeptide repeat protein [Leptolyngbyaceae cyanobacterium SL_1_1]